MNPAWGASLSLLPERLATAQAVAEHALQQQTLLDELFLQDRALRSQRALHGVGITAADGVEYRTMSRREPGSPQLVLVHVQGAVATRGRVIAHVRPRDSWHVQLRGDERVGRFFMESEGLVLVTPVRAVARCGRGPILSAGQYPDVMAEDAVEARGRFDGGAGDVN